MDRWQPHLLSNTPYRRWLRMPGSLTHALMRRCPAFNVVRLSQAAAPAHLDEGDALALPAKRLAVIREVLLRCGDIPLVFAHSVLPREGLRGPWESLSSLGNRPLAATLFSNPRIKRHSLEFRRLDRRHPLFRKACLHLDQIPPSLWARRSRFTLHGHSILVTEVFLPETLTLP